MRYRVSIHLPQWMPRWIGRLLIPRLEIEQDLGIQVDDIQEMEMIAAIEAEEAERAMPSHHGEEY